MSHEPVGSHWSDLLDGHRGVADVVDGGAHHPVGSLPDHLKVVVALGDLENTQTPRRTRKQQMCAESAYHFV